MKKSAYVKPLVEVVELAAEDIIRTSGELKSLYTTTDVSSVGVSVGSNNIGSITLQ